MGEELHAGMTVDCNVGGSSPALCNGRLGCDKLRTFVVENNNRKSSLLAFG